MTGVLWLLLGLGGCGSQDPELVATRAALDAWREGQARLATGDAAGAREAFETARRHRPHDVLLLAWHAEAAAADGDLQAAIALLDEALTARPDFGAARYNRAAYLARSGELERSAGDLFAALDLKAATPGDVRADADFVAHLEHPAIAAIPGLRPTVTLHAPGAELFWGSQVDVELVVTGVSPALQVEAPAAVGPLELVGVVQDRTDGVHGVEQRVRWTFRVIGAGTAALGPFRVTAGAFEDAAAAVALTCRSPPGREEPDHVPRALPLTAVVQVGAALDKPSVHRSGPALLVAVLPADRVALEPEPSRPPVRYELRESRTPQWVVLRYDAPTAPTRIRVSRGGATVVDEQVEP